MVMKLHMESPINAFWYISFLLGCLGLPVLICFDRHGDESNKKV